MRVKSPGVSVGGCCISRAPLLVVLLTLGTVTRFSVAQSPCAAIGGGIYTCAEVPYRPLERPTAPEESPFQADNDNRKLTLPAQHHFSFYNTTMELFTYASNGWIGFVPVGGTWGDHNPDTDGFDIPYCLNPPTCTEDAYTVLVLKYELDCQGSSDVWRWYDTRDGNKVMVVDWKDCRVQGELAFNATASFQVLLFYSDWHMEFHWHSIGSLAGLDGPGGPSPAAVGLMFNSTLGVQFWRDDQPSPTGLPGSGKALAWCPNYSGSSFCDNSQTTAGSSTSSSTPTTTVTVSSTTTTTVASSTTTSTTAVSASTAGPTAQASSSDANSVGPLPFIIAGVAGGCVTLLCVAVIVFLLARKRTGRDSEVTALELSEQNYAPMGASTRGHASQTAYDSIVSPNDSPVESSYAAFVATHFGGSGSGGASPSKRDRTVTASSGFDAEIAFEELEITSELGRGAFGVVFKGCYRGGDVAVKQLLEKVPGEALDDFLAESSVMARVPPHNNVVRYFGVAVDAKGVVPPAIITEFLQGGNLYNALRDQKLSVLFKKSSTMILLAKGIAAGMYHLASEKLVHRDLAARNILLSDLGASSMVPKVSDFGLSRVLGEAEDGGKTQSNSGPLKWMSTEALIDRSYSEKSDAWAFAVTLVEIATRDDPYPDLSKVQVAAKVSRGDLRPPVPAGVPQVIADLIKKCTIEDPDQRPTFRAITESLREA